MQTALTQSSGFVSETGFTRTIPGKIVLSLSATLVVAAAAHVSIPMWFTPVPLTLQPLAVLLVGLALGPVTGFMAMLAYLAEGAMGLPVFTPSGPGGMLQLLGPSGGYLMAYPLVALIAGAVARGLNKKMSSFTAAAVGCTLAVLVLYASGASWLMHELHLTVAQTWVAGVAPFAAGEGFKIMVAAGLYRPLSRWMRD